MTRAASTKRFGQAMAGSRSPLLQQLAVNLALQTTLPLLREAPHWIGSKRAKDQWQVHGFVLCRANPRASFCCVSPNRPQGESSDLEWTAALDPVATPGLCVVPMRFHPDAKAGVSIRPSSRSPAEPFTSQWLADADALRMGSPQCIHGVEVARFSRCSDGLEFLVAPNPAVAEVVVAELVRTIPLWRTLANAQPSLRQMILEAIM